jgi:hypothetical protein
MNLQALFVTALVGVLAAIGLALTALGWVVVTSYGVVVVVALGVLARRARKARGHGEEGRTCSCCTSTVFDPVEVR